MKAVALALASALAGFAGGIAVMWPALAWVCR